MDNINDSRIEELKDLIETKQKVLDSQNDELKVLIERQKATMRSIVHGENEIIGIKNKVELLGEKRASKELED